MCTIGYGDSYPKSIGGRIVGMFVSIWGVVLQSLLIATITQVLNFDDAENNAYMVMKRLDYINAYKTTTCNLYGMWRSIVLDQWLLKACNDPHEYNKISKRLKTKAKHLLSIRYNRKEVGEGWWEFEDQSEITYLAKKVDIMEENIKNMHKWQDAYDTIQEEILIKLISYFNEKFDFE